MPKEPTHYDTLIVGGGPAGIATAMHLGFHGYNVLIVDRRSSPMLFATTPVHNYPGVKPLLTSREIHRKMKTELCEFNVTETVGNVVIIRGTFPQFEVQIKTAKGVSSTVFTKTASISLLSERENSASKPID